MIRDDDDFAGKKSKIPYIFLAFFVVVLLVNVFYIYISKATWRGVATEDSYQKGLEYNEAIKAAKKQKKLGWKLKSNLRTINKNKAEITVTLEDKRYIQINDADIFAEFKRPTQDGLDFVAKLQSNGANYSAEVEFPEKGQWDVLIRAVKGEDKFREVKRYVIKW